MGAAKPDEATATRAARDEAADAHAVRERRRALTAEDVKAMVAQSPVGDSTRAWSVKLQLEVEAAEEKHAAGDDGGDGGGGGAAARWLEQEAAERMAGPRQPAVDGSRALQTWSGRRYVHQHGNTVRLYTPASL